MPTPAPPTDSARWPVLLVPVLAHLPLPLLYLLSDLLFLVSYHLFRYQRRLVADNLARALPERSPQERAKLAAKAYRNALQVLFETIAALRLPRERLLERVTVDNPVELERHLAAGRSVLVAAAHHGNWEWLQLACAARFDHPLDALYKPLGHPGLDGLLARLRGRFGTRLVAVGEALKMLLERRSAPRIMAMVADQGPRPDEDKVWYPFLGRDTAFFAGLEKIARLTDAPLLFAHMQRLSRGRYAVHFETLCEWPREVPEGEVMARYVRAVEAQVRAAPQDWLWVYKRWKYARGLYD